MKYISALRAESTLTQERMVQKLVDTLFTHSIKKFAKIFGVVYGEQTLSVHHLESSRFLMWRRCISGFDVPSMYNLIDMAKSMLQRAK